jgi:5-deoxy-glucuronate isomerase
MTGQTMLSETLFRQPRTVGLHTLQQRGEGGARELTTRRLILEPGSSTDQISADEETVVVLQRGRGAFAAGGRSWQVSRSDVFKEKATALYVPRATRFDARAETELEAVLFSTPAARDGSATLVTPDQVRVNARGRGSYSREVHDIFVDDPYVSRLMVGETFNPPGHWSSFPPHKHDGRDGEPTLEEVYYYRVDPPQGFGQQMLYTASGECTTHAVKDGDVVLLPYGYHPVSSPPGYRLYYLWAMAGEQRRLALHEDPAHRWIHDMVV